MKAKITIKNGDGLIRNLPHNTHKIFCNPDQQLRFNFDFLNSWEFEFIFICTRDKNLWIAKDTVLTTGNYYNGIILLSFDRLHNNIFEARQELRNIRKFNINDYTNGMSSKLKNFLEAHSLIKGAYK